MTKPTARDPLYRGWRFEPEIIELCVWNQSLKQLGDRALVSA
jgi:hypothetical protein